MIPAVRFQHATGVEGASPQRQQSAPIHHVRHELGRLMKFHRHADETAVTIQQLSTSPTTCNPHTGYQQCLNPTMMGEQCRTL